MKKSDFWDTYSYNAAQSFESQMLYAGSVFHYLFAIHSSRELQKKGILGAVSILRKVVT
jgi:hypothetical protein